MSAVPVPVPGDILSRWAGLLVHYGTAVGRDRVLDIVPGGPPRVVSLEVFAAGRPVRVQRPGADRVPAMLARARRLAESGSLYNVVTFNCEHVKNIVLAGKPYSETLGVLGLLAGFGLCVLALARGR